jgi:hypothetical protein
MYSAYPKNFNSDFTKLPPFRHTSTFLCTPYPKNFNSTSPNFRPLDTLPHSYVLRILKTSIRTSPNFRHLDTLPHSCVLRIPKTSTRLHQISALSIHFHIPMYCVSQKLQLGLLQTSALSTHFHIPVYYVSQKLQLDFTKFPPSRHTSTFLCTPYPKNFNSTSPNFRSLDTLPHSYVLRIPKTSTRLRQTSALSIHFHIPVYSVSRKLQLGLLQTSAFADIT